jgi:hypothetical protein
MKQKINNPTIGSDPEGFIWSSKDNKFVPVCGLIGGTKDFPLFITDKGHSVQEDNVAVEFTIPPCKTVDEFVYNLNYMKDHVQNHFNSKYGYDVVYQASTNFSIDDLFKHPAALIFGCEPDFNAWTLKENIIDKNNIDPSLRSTGFHVHVGFNKPNTDKVIKLIRLMDLHLGVPSVLIDKDTQRRGLYGKAGAFRLKPYGGEYRVLSSLFVSTEELIRWVYNSTMNAIDDFNQGREITNPDDIINAINNSNEELALEIMNDYGIEVFSPNKTEVNI